jgi:NADPH:quinone reductase-like Zn-dependent oxidoreductase
MKAVRFDDYGGVDVLEVRDVARPEPGPDQVLVEVIGGLGATHFGGNHPGLTAFDGT